MFTLGPALVAGAPTDPSFASVTLLLKGDGANGATTFTDSSSFVRSISRNGTTTITTAQSKFGGSSINFPGSASNLDCGSGISFTGAFTIEFWLRYTDETTIGQVLLSSSSASPYFYLSKGTNGTNSRIEARVNATSLTSAPYDLSVNTWYFVQFTRTAGGALSLYVGGALKDSSSNATSIPSGRQIYVGYDALIGNALVGQIDDLRITDGIVRSSAVPTEAFPSA